MAKRLLIFWAIVAGGFACAQAQAIDQTGPAGAGSTQAPAGPLSPPGSGASPQAIVPGAAAQNPPARLIKRRSDQRPAERPHAHPLDERCKAPREELEAALQKPGNAHRLFQARLALNAGSRLCRDGHAERGMAEFQRGLSYIQENAHP